MIGRDAVDVDRSVDRLAMWIDDERLDNAQSIRVPQRLRAIRPRLSWDRNVLEDLDPVPVW